jgi:hypothetical protein
MKKLVNSQQIFKKAQDTPWNIIDEEAVLLNLDSGHYYILNETGCRIWEMLDGKNTVADIAANICLEYDAEEETALQDTGRILRELLEEKLVENISLSKIHSLK